MQETRNQSSWLADWPQNAQHPVSACKYLPKSTEHLLDLVLAIGGFDLSAAGRLPDQ